VPLQQPSPSGDVPQVRRYLITLGVARYEHLGEDEQLESVTTDVEKIKTLLCGKDYGYEHVDLGLSTDPTADEMRASLGAWLCAPERDENDVLLLYYSGHGAVLHDRHFLYGRTTQPESLTASALRAEDLALMVAESPLRHVLSVLDCCYAGYGTGDIIIAAVSLQDSLKSDGDEARGKWAIAATRPKEEAQKSAVADALAAVLPNANAVLGGPTQRWLTPLQIVDALNRAFKERGFAQRSRCSLAAGESDADAPFFPNPHYRPSVPPGIDLETQKYYAHYKQDLTTHWDPRARGVEIHAQPGWYFTGRTAAIRKIVRWIAREEHPGRALVVTGRPGSGKSAVLGRIVTLADPECTKGADLSDVPRDTLPPSGAVDAAVHARRLTVREVTEMIALALGVRVDSPAELINAVAERDKPAVIVVDALDEAADPNELIRELIRPLTLVHSARLLVGTRTHLVTAIGEAKAVLSLDSHDYFKEADLVEYVARRLLAEDDEELKTPYRDHRELAYEVAKSVARRAAPVFLIARMVAHSLVYADQPLDTSQPGWADRFPSELADAFEEYLARFNEESDRVRNVLRPLAYAEGAGLPWEDFWAPLASVISGRVYSDADIEWVRRNAGPYIVEDREEGCSVYRLYNQAFADHLRLKAQDRTIQSRIVDVLSDHVPETHDVVGKDWPCAHPYVRNHLSTHAAAARRLNEFARDPLFLLTANPARLLTALSRAEGDTIAPIRHAYQLAFHHMRTEATTNAASYLEYAAIRCHADNLAAALRRLPLRRSWSILWAVVSCPSPHQVIPTGQQSVVALALADLSGESVIVSGGEDGTLRLWRLADGAPIGEPMRGHDRGATYVATGIRDGEPVAVSGGNDGTVRLWRLTDGKQIGGQLRGHRGWVRSVAIGDYHRQPIAASGGFDGTVRIWRLADGTQLGPPIQSHNGWVEAVALGVHNGEPVVVSGGDDGTLRVWHATEGKSIGKPMHGHDGWVTAVAIGEHDGLSVVASGGDDGTVQVWRLADGTPLGKPLRGHYGAVGSVLLFNRSGVSVVVSGGHDGTVRVWHLADGTPIGKPMRGHDGQVTSLAVSMQASKPVLVSGGDDRTVRIWRIADDPLLEEPTSGYDRVATSVTVGLRDGEPVVVAGEHDGTVRVWRLADGKPVGKPIRAYDDPVTSVAFGTVDGESAVVAGEHNGMVRVWRLADGKAMGKPIREHGVWVRSIAVGMLEGEAVVVSVGADRAVRVRRLPDGKPVGRPIRGYDDWVRSVAVGMCGDRPVVVSGGSEGTVQVRGLIDGRPVGKPVRGHEGWVTSVAIGVRDGDPVAVSGGSDGTVQVWGLADGKPIGEPMRGHGWGFTSVAVGMRDGETVVVSGGSDRTVRLWRCHLRKPLVVDIDMSVLGVALHEATNTIAVAGSQGVAVIALH